MKALIFSLLIVLPFLSISQRLINYSYLNYYTDSAVNSYLSYKGLDTNIFSSNNIESYSITYHTTDGKGSPTVASGAVYIPIKPNCYSAPILIYDHGTQFNLQACPSNGAYYTKGLRFSGTGFITVMPDYIGLGVNNDIQTYHHAETEAKSSIDLTRAVREFLLIHGKIQDNKEIYITGYSQGGHAAMATNKYIQENSLIDEFNVVASAPLSGAYDLSKTQRDFVFETPYYSVPLFLPNILIGYESVYSNLYNNYSDMFDSPYDSIYEVNVTNKTTSGIFWQFNTPSNTYDFMQDSVIQNMLADTFSLSHPVNLALKNNNVYDWGPQNPMRILYCSSDNVVSPTNSLFTLDTMTSLGAIDVESINVSSTHSHGGCGTPTLNYTSLWFDSIKSPNCTKGSFSNIGFCSNDSVLYNGTYYSQNTLISDTLQTINSEDSIVSLFIYKLSYNSAKIYSSTSNDTVCSSDSLFLASKNYEYNHTWSNSLTDSAFFNPTHNLTYYLFETDTNGCNSSDSISFSVVNYPTLNISSSSDTICFGESITLSDNHNGLYGNWSYNYVSNLDYQLGLNTTLFYTSYNSSNCFAKDTISIIVNPKPSINLSTVPTSLCIGDSVFLNATGTANITWNNSLTNNDYYTPTSSLTYEVIGTNNFNCTDTSSFTIIVNDLPNVTSNADQLEMCKDNFNIIYGSGALTYEWNDSSIIDNAYSSPFESKYYTVIGIDSNGCKATDSIFIDVHDLPPVLSLQRDTIICQFDSLFFSTISNSNLQYSWEHGINNNSYYTPLVSEYITVSAIDNINCQSIDSIFVTINTLPSVSANASMNEICKGDSIYFWATVNSTSIEWSNNISNNNYYIPDSSFYATLMTIDNNQCLNSDSIFITVNSIPSPIITNSSGVLSTTNFSDYQWNLNGISITNATNQDYMPNYSGNYTVTVNENNCTASSPDYYFNSTVINQKSNESIYVYPNPSNGLINISGLVTNMSSIRIINNIGELVLKSQVTNNHLDISLLPKGFYTLLIEQNNQIITYQITKL